MAGSMTESQRKETSRPLTGNQELTLARPPTGNQKQESAGPPIGTEGQVLAGPPKEKKGMSVTRYQWGTGNKCKPGRRLGTSPATLRWWAAKSLVCCLLAINRMSRSLGLNKMVFFIKVYTNRLCLMSIIIIIIIIIIMHFIYRRLPKNSRPCLLGENCKGQGAERMNGYWMAGEDLR